MQVYDIVGSGWSITLRSTGEEFRHGSLIFVGRPWSRRATVFLAKDADGDRVVIKEYYRHISQRFKEEQVLEHIHADGYIPGVVRPRCAEVVAVDGQPLQCGKEEDGTLREKFRLVLWDVGEPLERAKAINDLLRCIYDALEGMLTNLLDP